MEPRTTSPLAPFAPGPLVLTSSTLPATSATLGLGDRGSSWVVEDVPELPVPQWRRLEPANPPSPRFRPLMAYESDRQRTLLFGGFLENQSNCNETWEFDGRAWKRIDVPAPPADSGYMMDYDIYRGVAVLYGGRNRDTWTFDGVRWNRRRCEHRPPITGFGAMTYDPNSRHIVLFGGEALPPGDSPLPVLSDEVWQFDGMDWMKLDVRGPSPRKYHQMVYDSARERFVVFGGFTGKLRNETWELREAGWRQVESPEAPSPRKGFGLTYDPIGRRTLLFGGSPGGDELWSFDGAKWSRVMPLHSPPFREGAGFVFIPITRRVLLFGGLSGQLLNDSWELIRGAPERTVLLPPPPPSSPLEALAEQLATTRRPAGPPGPKTTPPVKPVSEELPEPPRPAIPARPPAPPVLTPTPAARVSDIAESTTRSQLAELHFKDIRVLQFQLVPGRGISVAGYLVNTGKKDARCWIEFWLSRHRQPFEHNCFACQSQSVEVKAGGSADLWRFRLTLSPDIPPGEYYFGVEADRGNEVPEQDKTNNLFIIDTPYTVAKPR